MRHKDAEGYVTHSLLPILHTNAHKRGQTNPLLGAGAPWSIQGLSSPRLTGVGFSLFVLTSMGCIASYLRLQILECTV